MRKLDINFIKPHTTNGKSIYLFTNKHKLLNKGAELKPEYIRRLKELGINHIYVEDRISEGIEIQEMISEELQVQANECIFNIMNLVQHNHKSVRTKPVIQTVNGIIDEIFSTKNLAITLADIRATDDYTFGHSVSVCTLALVLGSVMGLNDIDLRDLGIGSILHDIGKTKVPLSILNKPDKLTDEEFEIIKTHPKEGFNILRKFDDLNRNSVYVALGHHERYDGSGYPNGFTNSETHLFAKIVSVVDVFDAMTSDRVYRKGMDIKKVTNYLQLMSGKHFDGEIVDKFISKILIYPNGSYVLLNTNEKAIVVKSDLSCPLTPVVRICVDPEGNFYKDLREIDLSSNMEYSIIGTCDEFIEK